MFLLPTCFCLACNGFDLRCCQQMWEPSSEFCTCRSVCSSDGVLKKVPVVVICMAVYIYAYTYKSYDSFGFIFSF